MSRKALQIIEEAYDVVLNPTQSYFAQLEPLGANGELSNRNNLNKVVFRLCELIDEQAKEIKALKEDQTVIAKELVEVGEFAKLKPIEPVAAETPDPIVDVQAPDPTKPIADSSL